MPPANLMPLALHELPLALADSSRKKCSFDVAEKLPFSRWSGFEIALEEGATRLDMHQAFYPTANDLITLQEHLSSAHLGEKFHRVLTRWQQRITNLARYVNYFVLEFDVQADGSVLPALFIAFTDDVSMTRRFLFTRKLLQRLGFSTPVILALQQSFNACRDRETITHVGLMLSRSSYPVRINVRHVDFERVPAYLRAAGYTDDTSDICQQFLVYSRYVDRVILCLDVQGDAITHVGLEFTLLKQPNRDPRYQRLLWKLATEQLCSAEKHQPIIDWCGHISVARHTEWWPETLLIESLTQPAHVFSTIEKYISHIKLQRHQGELKAKVYLGFRQKYLGQEITSDYSQQNLPRPTENCTVNESIAGAVEYLQSKKHQSGWWREYSGFSFACSDEWISAYVACVLSSPGLADRYDPLSINIWEQLRRSVRTDGGWGWNAWIASDADTTTWVLRLASQLGVVRDSVIAAAEAFVAEHVQSDGGTATYEESHFKAFHASKTHPLGLADWCSSHNCVTAASSVLMPFSQNGIHFLEKRQRDDGSWQGYWWPDPEFTTALTVSAFASSPKQETVAAIADARRWVVSRMMANGGVQSQQTKAFSPFATANGLMILLDSAKVLDDQETPTEHQLLEKTCVRWLMEQQLDDGSWSASALMFSDPLAEPGKYHIDQERIHTTATVLNALNRYKLMREF